MLRAKATPCASCIGVNDVDLTLSFAYFPPKLALGGFPRVFTALTTSTSTSTFVLSAGFDVIGCDPSREARRSAESFGVRTVDGPAHVPKGAGTIILSLPGFGVAAAVAEELAALDGPRSVLNLLERERKEATLSIQYV